MVPRNGISAASHAFWHPIGGNNALCALPEAYIQSRYGLGSFLTQSYQMFVPYHWAEGCLNNSPVYALISDLIEVGWSV